jgi:hypothetical protein
VSYNRSKFVTVMMETLRNVGQFLREYTVQNPRKAVFILTAMAVGIFLVMVLNCWLKHSGKLFLSCLHVVSLFSFPFPFRTVTCLRSTATSIGIVRLHGAHPSR